MKVLIVGDNLRACLSVSDVLYYHSITVDVLGHWSLHLEKFKSIHKYFNLNQLPIKLDFYKKKIQEITISNNYSAIIPITDEALEIVNYYKSIFSTYSRIVGLPDERKWEYAKNKYYTLQLFSRLNFKIPQTIIYNSKKEFYSALPGLPFPFIIKSVSSRKIVDGKILSSSVHFVPDQKVLDKLLIEDTQFPLMKQEIVYGDEFGFNFYSENGKILNFYIDKKLYGVPGRESTCRRVILSTEPEYSKIIKEFEIVINELKWNGWGMFDFKWINDQIYIIEFNPRFWASIYMDKLVHSNILNSIVQRCLFNKIDFILPNKNNKNVILHNWHNELLFGRYLINDFKFFSFLKWIFSLKKILGKNQYLEIHSRKHRI